MTASSPAIRVTDSSIINDVLVIGFSSETKKGKKSFSLHTGSLKIDHAPLIEALTDLGASGAADEVIKLPGTTSK